MPFAADDDGLRLRFFRAAADAFGIPDPVGSLTIAAVAKRSGIAGSTILDQIDNDAHPDGPMAEFRRLVFHELIRRVQPAPRDQLHAIAVRGLRDHSALPAVITQLVDLTAQQFRVDPSTRFLLAASARSDLDQDLADVTASVWATLSDPVLDLIELVVAAHGLRFADGVDRPQLSELLAVSIANLAVWDTIMHVPPRSLRWRDGTELSPPALFVWSVLDPLLLPTEQLGGVE